MENLSFNELLVINGGSTITNYNDGYKSGHAAGVYVKQILEGVGILGAIRTLLAL